MADTFLRYRTKSFLPDNIKFEIRPDMKERKFEILKIDFEHASGKRDFILMNYGGDPIFIPVYMEYKISISERFLFPTKISAKNFIDSYVLENYRPKSNSTEDERWILENPLEYYP